MRVDERIAHMINDELIVRISLEVIERIAFFLTIFFAHERRADHHA